MAGILSAEGRAHRGDTTTLENTRRRLSNATAYQVVQKARQYTTGALLKLFNLMEGRAGKLKVLNKDGDLVEVDIEVPASVMAKCAEILLDRGWGKSPQAIMLKTDSPLNLTEGEQRNFTVQEKIQMLLAAKMRDSGAV